MKHLYPLCLCLFLVSACGSPLQVVRVAPEYEEDIDRYRYGNPVQSHTDGEVTVEVSYYDASRDYLVFDAEVMNHSDRDILFDPVDSYITFAGGRRVTAEDPEFQLLSMDLHAVEKARTARTLAWAGAAVLVAATVYSVANADAAVPEATTDAAIVADLGIRVADAMTFAVLQQNNSAIQRNWLPAPDDIPGPDNRFFWLDYSFRKTTLRPGESAVGKLVFARSDVDEHLLLTVPVAGRQTYTFGFTQRIYRDRR